MGGLLVKLCIFGPAPALAATRSALPLSPAVRVRVSILLRAASTAAFAPGDLSFDVAFALPGVVCARMCCNTRVAIGERSGTRGAMIPRRRHAEGEGSGEEALGDGGDGDEV